MSLRAVFLLAPPYREIGERFCQQAGNVGRFGIGFTPVPEAWVAECEGYLDLHDVVESARDRPVPDDIREQCRNLEQRFRINLADVLVADRHLGISWLTGGLYHRGKLSYLPYERHLLLIREVFESVERFLRETRPDFVCPGIVGSFQGAVIHTVCRHLEIPLYALNTLSYESLYYWQKDRFGSIPGLEEAFEGSLASSSTDDDPASIQDIAPWAQQSVSATLAKTRMSHLVNRLARVTFKHWRRALGRKRRIGGLFWHTKASYLLQNFLNARRELRREYEDIDLSRVKYVYYPLHYEPEASLNGVEPHFSNQLYAIELLSKGVPADVRVLVKEHPGAVGNRPRGWMDTVSGFPRVTLLPPFTNSIDVIRNSMATATITGTAGLEAAILGKPVLSFGPNYRLNFLPHVHHVGDLKDVRATIEKIREQAEAGVRLEREGAALKAAVEKTCFLIQGNIFVGTPSENAAEIAARQLITSLHRDGLVT